MTKPETSAPRRQSWTARLVCFVVFLGFYRLLVGTDERAEWVVGAVAAALGSVGASAVAAPLPPWRVSGRGVVRVLTVIPQMVGDSVRVAAAALMGEVPGGTFAVVPIDPGGDDAGSTGRRSLVILGASLAPNSLVVTLDQGQGALLVHQLLPSRQPSGHGDREWPL